MRNYILTVDWILLVTFTLIILSKIVSLPFEKVLQPIFFGFIIIHIYQHRRILINSFKKQFFVKK